MGRQAKIAIDVDPNVSYQETSLTTGIPDLQLVECERQVRNFIEFHGGITNELCLMKKLRFLAVYKFSAADEENGASFSGWIVAGNAPFLMLNEERIYNAIEALAIYAWFSSFVSQSGNEETEDNFGPQFRTFPNWKLLREPTEIARSKITPIAGFIGFHVVPKHIQNFLNPEIFARCYQRGWFQSVLGPPGRASKNQTNCDDFFTACQDRDELTKFEMEVIRSFLGSQDKTSSHIERSLKVNDVSVFRVELQPSSVESNILWVIGGNVPYYLVSRKHVTSPYEALAEYTWMVRKWAQYPSNDLRSKRFDQIFYQEPTWSKQTMRDALRTSGLASVTNQMFGLLRTQYNHIQDPISISRCIEVGWLGRSSNPNWKPATKIKRKELKEAAVYFGKHLIASDHAICDSKLGGKPCGLPREKWPVVDGAASTFVAQLKHPVLGFSTYIFWNQALYSEHPNSVTQFSAVFQQNWCGESQSGPSFPPCGELVWNSGKLWNFEPTDIALTEEELSLLYSEQSNPHYSKTKAGGAVRWDHFVNLRPSITSAEKFKYILTLDLTQFPFLPYNCPRTLHVFRHRQILEIGAVISE